MNDRPTGSGARILLFTGDGKGKTTAALGMVLRAFGHGTSCSVLQFIKADTSVGEYAALQRLGIPIEMAGRGFVKPSDEDRRMDHHEAAKRAMERAATILSDPNVQLVVLDEICLAVALGMVAEDEVRKLCASARSDQILVLTGRDATPGVIAMADTVTLMVPLKHAYSQRIPAQQNVEF